MNHFRLRAACPASRGSSRPAIAVIALAVLLATATAEAATPVHKCSENGVVTFQNTPCRPDDPGARPTAAQLNAERQKKLRQQGAAASSAQHQQPAAAPVATSPPGRFKCDGRTHCSQMSSCAEARYFRANCPGAKMDGDKNGIPCERQWCNR
jgi:hypothetical protein